MLYAGLDLSRKRLDFHLLDGDGATVEVGAAPPDADGLLGLTRRLDRHREPIRAAIESMNGARFVHDRLELQGWQVEIADAQKVKGLAPLACKTDRIDAWVLAELTRRDLVPAIWLPGARLPVDRLCPLEDLIRELAQLLVLPVFQHERRQEDRASETRPWLEARTDSSLRRDRSIRTNRMTTPRTIRRDHRSSSN